MNFSRKNHEHKKDNRTIVSKTKLTIIASFIALISLAQTGINYKALIKDTNGNVIANQSIDMVFTIELEGESAYSELQVIVTDSNGIAIATIGVGSVISGDFDTIDWNRGNAELNVQIDFGTGLVDFGNTLFNAVPYAINTLRPEGLETINEGNGIGWRLAGINTDFYGNIGTFAIDLSYNDENSSTYGATGPISNAFGRSTTASGLISTAMGSYTIASGQFSTAMGFVVEASGDNSMAAGYNTIAQSANETVIGRYNTPSGSSNNWIGTDPLFTIGNGASSFNRNNALTVLKNGQHTINSEAAGLVIRDAINAIIISDSQANSIDISDAGFHGIRVNNATADGILISNAQQTGITASGLNRGGYFSGGNAGIYATATISDNPDIILRGNSSANAEDDGIIASDPSYTGSDIYFRSNDAIVAELDNDNNGSGSFIVRNGSDDNVFEVNEAGTVRVNGSIVHSSDRRLKTEITNLNYGLKEILQLQPKSYFWKDQEQTKKSFGLIAQDTQIIIDEIITVRDDEFKTLGISYTELIPILINAIKEQQNIIESQNEALKTSKDNYEALLSRIEDLEANQSN